MIVTYEFKGKTWYLHKVAAKNKKTVYFMRADQTDACSADEDWLRTYEIINGRNMPMIKKRKR